ncbi:MAG: TerB family tellurite resistance protein [Prevotella sp.]|nr:TerB family tellurite resistance protein [Prevotella sp.]
MTFNELQMIAIAKLAKAMIAADGKVEQAELTAMAIEFTKFGVSKDALSRILSNADSMESGTAIAIVSLMNEAQKKYVTGYLAFIMAADGEIADSEVAMWSLISTLATLPTMTIGQALAFWKDN